MKSHIGLVAFDLDGTLLREDTVCLAIAARLGRRERMLEMERLTEREDLRAARAEMADWYREVPESDLCAAVEGIPLAPGTRKGFQLLKQHRIHIALVSMTWEFAVARVARTLGADSYVGTRLLSSGQIGHVWPEDKVRWVADLATRLGLTLDEVAAVGDSAGDVPMLRDVGHPYFVGTTMPTDLHGVAHIPDGNIAQIAREIVAAGQR